MVSKKKHKEGEIGSLEVSELLSEFRKEEQRELPVMIKSFVNFLFRRPEITYSRKIALRQRLEKAGLRIDPGIVSSLMFGVSVLLNIIFTFYLSSIGKISLPDGISLYLAAFMLVWILVLFALSFAMWFALYAGLDLLMYKRMKALEDVLPDFLQLASSNIRAGMTVDRALWFAVRPRFGILAKEIEEVAKRTMAGESLEFALGRFVDKYDSETLERSMNILLEGVRAGGEVGSLLNKIATNIQQTNIMKKEMAANVTTYVIFISFATVIAAPFLLGLAYQLISVIQEVFSKVDLSPGAVSGMSVSISQDVISLSDFKLFAVASLLITSFFSSIIISTIKKGNVKDGLKYIPVFMVSTVVLFFIILKLFGVFVGGLF